MPLQTKSIKYMDENWAAQNVEVSTEDLERIHRIIKEQPVKGEQYSEALSSLVDRS